MRIPIYGAIVAAALNSLLAANLLGKSDRSDIPALAALIAPLANVRRMQYPIPPVDVPVPPAAAGVPPTKYYGPYHGYDWEDGCSPTVPLPKRPLAPKPPPERPLFVIPNTPRKPPVIPISSPPAMSWDTEEIEETEETEEIGEIEETEETEEIEETEEVEEETEETTYHYI